MGKAELSVEGFSDGIVYEEWIQLQSVLTGDYSQGALHVQVSLTSAPNPVYQLTLLTLGVFLTTIGLCWGFYVWRADKIAQQASSLDALRNPLA